MSEEEITSTIQKAIKEAYPKEWLSKDDLSKEFGIKSTTIWKITNDPHDPLPYSSIGDKKQLFKREDVNAFLERRKRNAV